MDWRVFTVGFVLLSIFFLAGFSQGIDAPTRFALVQWWSANQVYVYLFLLGVIVLFAITSLKGGAPLTVKPMSIGLALELARASPVREERERTSWLLDSGYFRHGSDFGREIFRENGIYKIKFNPVKVLPPSAPFKAPVFLWLFAYASMIPRGGSPFAGITDVAEDFAYYRSKKVTNSIIEFTGIIDPNERIARYAFESEERPYVVQQVQPQTQAI